MAVGIKVCRVTLIRHAYNFSLEHHRCIKDQGHENNANDHCISLTKVPNQLRKKHMESSEEKIHTDAAC